MDTQLYIQRPTVVEAQRFRGWADAENASEWLRDLNPFFVPQGYDHPLRLPSERDRKQNEVFADAKAYLVLKTEGKSVRVDLGRWIVRFHNKAIQIFTDAEFVRLFEEKTG